ncbi:pentapeptide repeat-containing protein, partial [Streptomyces sp. NPDC056653]|uniref:pentapeptide repeat-containing protein n=1 Tax=Streptomyces sp. NPDC056653 TaxID=3345894 RepID=UPI00368404D7
LVTLPTTQPGPSPPLPLQTPRPHSPDAVAVLAVTDAVDGSTGALLGGVGVVVLVPVLLFGFASAAGGRFVPAFHAATFGGGTVIFDGARFSGGTVAFDGARFSGGTVAFDGARFSGCTVDFDGAEFSGEQFLVHRLPLQPLPQALGQGVDAPIVVNSLRGPFSGRAEVGGRPRG